MASESSIRLWRVCKEANRPWPVICSEDDVLDYMIMEAVFLRVRRQDERDQQAHKVSEWKETAKQDLLQYT